MMADGHLNFCKRCVRVRVTRHREQNLSRIQAYDSGRAQQAHRIAGNIKTARRFRRRNPALYGAQRVVSNAIGDGKLVRGSCEQCGKPNANACHKDPAHPLAITWLCPTHRHAMQRGKLLIPLTA